VALAARGARRGRPLLPSPPRTRRSAAGMALVVSCGGAVAPPILVVTAHLRPLRAHPQPDLRGSVRPSRDRGAGDGQQHERRGVLPLLPRPPAELARVHRGPWAARHG
jgi:hypothetical protein